MQTSPIGRPQDIKMNNKLVLFLALLLSATACSAKNSLSYNIHSYIHNAETCEHLAGEAGGQDPADNVILNKNIDKYCGKAQKQLNKLKNKYKNNKSVMHEISKHEYDSVTSFTK